PINGAGLTVRVGSGPRGWCYSRPGSAVLGFGPPGKGSANCGSDPSRTPIPKSPSPARVIERAPSVRRYHAHQKNKSRPMRRAALGFKRQRGVLLPAPCLAGLVAAFVVPPSPAAQKLPPSQQPKLWALGVTAGKVSEVKISRLQWLRRRGIQALVVNATALTP